MSKPASRPAPPAVIPGNVRAGQVISLVEVTGGLGSRIDARKLADELGMDIAVLLPVLDAAEMLGLVRSEKADVYLTDLGRRFQETSKDKVKMLRDVLVKIEPIHTAHEITNKRGSVTAEEVAEALSRRGVRWHYKPEMNEALVKGLLIHWATYAGLLRYNGKSNRFQKA